MRDVHRRSPVRVAPLVAVLIVIAAPARAAESIEGEWLTADGGGRVSIGACPDKPDLLCGVASWLAARARGLARHGSTAKPPAEVTVSTVVGFRQAAPGRWTGGKLYDGSSGRTYNARIVANPDGTLKVEGCLMMLCLAQILKRS
jgi:uncharacterized protein (DUF2147 family)